MDKLEKEAIENEQELNRIKGIDFKNKPKSNLIELIEFIRENYFKEFVKAFMSYEEWLRGN